MVGRRAWLWLGLAGLVCLSAGRVALAGDGAQVWKTIESEHFVVHYYEPLGEIAKKIAAAGERSNAILAPVFGYQPDEKTHIVLQDTTDGANGFASALPRNQITLFVAAPSGLSALNDNDNWLFNLTSHEYTHILHLDAIGGLPFLYNKVLGKTWSPNQLQPRWIIEGLATHEESKRSSSGRNRSSLFDMEMRVAVLAGEELELDAMSSSPRAWPHGNAAYLYGSHFLQYIFDSLGEDKVGKMSWVYGSAPVPYGINNAIYETTGERYDALYAGWLEYMRSRYTAQLEAIERRGRIEGRRLTFTGEGTSNPKFDPTGSFVVFRESDGLSEARFRALPAGRNAAAVRDYAEVDRAGGFDVMADGSLVVEQTRTERTNYSWQELMLWHADTRRLQRLTYQVRARDPSISPDERWVAFTKNGESKSELAIIPLHADAIPEVLYSGPGRYDQVYSPEWSPSGRQIVFSAWSTGGFRDILLYDLDSREVRRLTHDRAIDADPVFSPDGRFVYFSSDRSGIYNLYAYRLEDGTLRQVTNVLGCALTPTVSPDGKTLVYQGFDVGGYDLYELAVDESKWLPARPYIDDRPDPVELRPVATTPPRDYRPIETLAPRAYTISTASTSLGTSVTVATQGADMIGRHSYNLSTTVRLDDGNVAVSGSYAYTRHWAGLRVAASRNAARRGGVILDGRNTLFTEEVMGITAGLSFPVLRMPSASANLSLDYDFDWLRDAGDDLDMFDPNEAVPRFPETDVTVTGLALRFNYTDTSGFLYTIGPQEGRVLALSARINSPALGGDFHSLELNYRWEWYHQLPFSPTSVFALRLAGGLRATDRQRSGLFVLGGVPEQDVINSALNDIRVGAVGYLRGYPQRSIVGSQFHLLDLELRQQLINIEKGFETLPLYFRRLHVAALSDMGNAFDDAIDLRDFKVSVGAALRADVVLGYFVPGTLDVGYAHGLTGDGVGEFWMLLTGTL